MPLFLWLLGEVTLFSLFFVTLVLVAQKLGDELNAPRDIRTLELAILREQKIAKVIQLLEGLPGASASPRPCLSTGGSNGAARETREPSARRRQASLR